MLPWKLLFALCIVLNALLRKTVKPMRRPGIPIVICTHNDAERLKPTIDHLKHQRLRSNFQWEVPVADNALTDLSGDCARQLD
jgi:hypothetical protein